MRAAPLTIGLVNNMPDAALAATERQFTRVLQSAAGEREVRLKLFSLPDVPRSEHAQALLRGRYADIDALPGANLDGLIVTGSEPRTPDLAAEPYFPHLTRLIDWAESNGVSTVWSCLAAHAAVLHLDGVRRRHLKEKLSGVFACERAADHPLLSGVEAPLTPHSRQNELVEGDLTAAGYQVLTRSPQAGVDLFVRDQGALFVFFQGHPEYDADSLLREYCRDVGRYLRGEHEGHPSPPHGYFSAATVHALKALASEAARDRGLHLMARYLEITGQAPADTWRVNAQRVYANWLNEVAARQAANQTIRAAGA